MTDYLVKWLCPEKHLHYLHKIDAQPNRIVNCEICYIKYMYEDGIVIGAEEVV